MYIPAPFEESRPEVLHALIRENSFGILVTHEAGQVAATHLPLLLRPERGPRGALVGHMARANPQWHSFQPDTEVLAIFSGPHAYISPSWYEAELAVPTWNYAAVHAYGIPATIEDPDELFRVLDAMVRTYEAPLDPPWPLHLPEDYMSRMMNGIVGFEIAITRLEGKRKLSQNRSEADQARVATALTQLGDPSGYGIAEMMKAQAAVSRSRPPESER